MLGQEARPGPPGRRPAPGVEGRLEQALALEPVAARAWMARTSASRERQPARVNSRTRPCSAYQPSPAGCDCRNRARRARRPRIASASGLPMATSSGAEKRSKWTALAIRSRVAWLARATTSSARSWPGPARRPRDLIARAVHFDRFSAPLCVAIGSPDAEAILGRMARRALFLQSHPAGDGWYALHGLVREFTLGRLALPDDEVRAIQARAAAWFEGEGLLEAALDARLLADDPTALAAFLSEPRPGPRAGRRDAQGHRRERPGSRSAERTARLERAVGEAHLVRGDWREAYAAFDRAAGIRGHLDAATAWRMGLIHGLRGAYGEALEVYSKAVVDGRPAGETKRCSTRGSTSAHYHRGEVAASRASAEGGRSGWPRHAAGDERALAAAWTAIGMSHDLDHRPGLARQAFESSSGLGRARRRHAPGRAHPIGDGRPRPSRRGASTTRWTCSTARCGWPRRSASPPSRRASWSAAVEPSRASDNSRRRSPTSRPRATCTSASARHRCAYALTREGSLPRPARRPVPRPGRLRTRGAGGQRRRRPLHPGPGVHGPGRGHRPRRPGRGARLVARALELGGGLEPVDLHIGARCAWPSPSATAPRRPTQAAIVVQVADQRRDDPGLASGLELQAETIDDPAEARRLVEAAAAIWERPRPVRDRPQSARVLAGRGRDPRVAPPRSRPRRLFRSLGARGQVAAAARRIDGLKLGCPAAAGRRLARALPGGVRDGEVVRRRPGSRRRPATC